MKRGILSDRQAISMVCMFTIGTPMIYGVARPAEENAWISLILAVVISIPIQLMYGRLLRNFHGNNIFEILDIIFGKAISKIISLLFIWNAIYLASILFRGLQEFIAIVGLNDTPEMISISLVVILCIITLKVRVNTFGKWCEFFVAIVFVVIVITITFLIPLMKMDNIVPVMYDGIKPVLQGTIYALAFPFTQSAVFLMVFDGLKNKKSYNKVFLKGVILGAIILWVITFADIAILGKSNFSHVYFPSYMTLRRLSVGEFFQRVEMMVILNFMIVGFVKVVTSLFGAVKGITHLFNLEDSKFIAAPICFLCAILGYLSYGDTIEQRTVLKDVYVPYALLLHIVLPFIIFIAGEIRSRKNQTN